MILAYSPSQYCIASLTLGGGLLLSVGNCGIGIGIGVAFCASSNRGCNVSDDVMHDGSI
jgi:hypothetical protein